MTIDHGRSASPPGHSAEPEPSCTVSAVPVSVPNAVTISGELYAFLMGTGPLEGVWFGEMNRNFRGAFWWRALLRCAAGWPDASADRSPEGGDHEDGRHAKHESAMLAEQTPNTGRGTSHG